VIKSHQSDDKTGKLRAAAAAAAAAGGPLPSGFLRFKVKVMIEKLRVLNLGAGVQSTAIYLMMIDGEIPPADIAIFADVQEEPQEVYEHLERLKTLGGPEIVTVTRGKLGDNLVNGVNATGQRFASIPAFLKTDAANGSIGRRQGTSEYKIVPIEKEIRQRMDAVGKPLGKTQSVTQVFGLSFDEPRRVERVKSNFIGRRGWTCEFPLFDDYITRVNCVSYLQKRWGNAVPRSACVFCPYKTDAEWIRLRENDPVGWNRAVEIDNAIRDPRSRYQVGMVAKQYLHRSCEPLELVQLNAKPVDRQKKMNFTDMDCEGMCGV
jgi:hypothetical protein